MKAPACERPRDLPDLQNWLLSQYAPGGHWRWYAEAVQKAVLSGQLPGGVTPLHTAHEVNMLKRAQLWWVSEEMCDVIMAAATSIPDDVKMEDIESPAPFGMVVFEKGWEGADSQFYDDARDGQKVEEHVTVNMILWGRSRLAGTDDDKGPTNAYSFSAYEKLDFANGLTPRQLQVATTSRALQAHGSVLQSTSLPMDAVVAEHDMWTEKYGEMLPVSVSQSSPDGPPGPIVTSAPGADDYGTRIFDRAGRNTAQTINVGGYSWVPLGRSDWPDKTLITEAPYNPEAHEPWMKSLIEDRRVIAAFWSVLHQESIAQKTREAAPRPVRRRAERSGVTTVPDVRVVALRRPRVESEDSDGLGHGGNYSHRWIVQPHYRWQAYGPNRSKRKLILIGSYVKGPADKPLKTPTVVKALIR